MTLYYKGIKAARPDKEGKHKWHLSLVKTRKMVTTNDLAEDIAEKSSLTPGDVHNVIRNLTSAMKAALMNCQTVKLDGLGTFTLHARTRNQGVDTEDEVNPGQITSLQVKFRPEYRRTPGVGTITKLTQGAEFVSVKALAKKKKKTSEK